MKHAGIPFFAAAVLSVFCSSPGRPGPAFPDLESYNVSWESPSLDGRGSMPLGNGDIGLNVWAEASGDILFYIGKTDAWDDNGRLLKLGRVRVSLRPNPFGPGSAFRQELRLRQGEVSVDGRVEGRPVRTRIWVDANRPVIHVQTESETPVRASVSFEPWRTERTTLPSLEVSDMYHSAPPDKLVPTVVEPDTVLAGLQDEVGWCHRNIKSVGPELTMRFQDLMEAPWKDPLLHRTFGALIRAEGGRRADDRTLECPPTGRHRVSVHVLAKQPATVEEWLAALRESAKAAEAVDFETRRKAHLGWWAAFWDRSAVSIRDTAPDGPGKDVARGYNLQRFINACAGRGAYPIKFNGSLFNVAWPDKPGDADYRRWGPGYWWQNSRLPYIGACASGDFDLFEPFFRMYAGEVFEVSKYRTRRYFGHPGAYYPECIYPWGAVFMESYGWDKPAAERADKLQTSGWHKWEWVAGLELAWMMLDYSEHTEDEAFLRDKTIPLALEVMTFFDRYYKTDERGKLVMHPAQALETWWDSTNPMSELAGLQALAARLLDLPGYALPAEGRRFVESLRAKLPELPVREVEGVRMLAPAEKFADKRNVENPELYAVFPFRLCSFEKANASLGIEALHRRLDKGHTGWRQDDVFMAYLGLAEEAKANVAARARTSDPNCRFPAFWGPNYDWTPDQDHGGILVKAVQAMLIQTEGRAIFLLPAWPKDWEADFKLHAPYRTVVEGSVRAGKLVSWTVTPPSRRSDVLVTEAWRND